MDRRAAIGVIGLEAVPVAPQPSINLAISLNAPPTLLKSALSTQWEKPAAAAIDGTARGSPVSQEMGETILIFKLALTAAAAFAPHGDGSAVTTTTNPRSFII